MISPFTDIDLICQAYGRRDASFAADKSYITLVDLQQDGGILVSTYLGGSQTHRNPPLVSESVGRKQPTSGAEIAYTMYRRFFTPEDMDGNPNFIEHTDTASPNVISMFFFGLMTERASRLHNLLIRTFGECNSVPAASMRQFLRTAIEQAASCYAGWELVSLSDVIFPRVQGLEQLRASPQCRYFLRWLIVSQFQGTLANFQTIKTAKLSAVDDDWEQYVRGDGEFIKLSNTGLATDSVHYLATFEAQYGRIFTPSRQKFKEAFAVSNLARSCHESIGRDLPPIPSTPNVTVANFDGAPTLMDFPQPPTVTRMTK